MPTLLVLTAARTAASSCWHPVVPTTRLIPRRASTGTFTATADGTEKSIATSTLVQRSDAGPPLALSMMPATSQPYSGARLSTRRPIRP